VTRGPTLNTTIYRLFSDDDHGRTRVTDKRLPSYSQFHPIYRLISDELQGYINLKHRGTQNVGAFSVGTQNVGAFWVGTQNAGAFCFGTQNVGLRFGFQPKTPGNPKRYHTGAVFTILLLVAHALLFNGDVHISTLNTFLVACPLFNSQLPSLEHMHSATRAMVVPTACYRTIEN
jgi:hypothetical protein